MAKKSFEIINPFTEEVDNKFDYHTLEEVKDIIVKADRVFHSDWKKNDVQDRVAYLSKAADLLEQRKTEVAKIASREMGKPLEQSTGEVAYCIEILKYYAAHAEEFLQDKPIPYIEHGEAYLTNEPLGVLLSIQPWNYPFSQLVRFAAPNIAAGNTLIVKPAKNTYQSALAIQAVFDEAGLPEGVYNTFNMDTDLIEEIIADDKIKGVTLTGSDAAGASVAELAGKYLKKSVLELGGSDPFLVLDKANIDDAVKGVIIGRFENSGQVCTSSKRIIVVESVYDKFVEALKPAIEKIKIGDPLDESTEFGPMSSEQQMDTVLEQIQKSIEAGAQLELGGERIDRKGFFIAPTLLTNVKKGQPAFDEEIFGPVAAIIKAKDAKEAVELANDCEYGLGGTIFCEDIEHAKQVGKEIETGMVFINRPTTSVPQLPFGGVKNSGYGKELSWIALTEFTNRKLMRVTTVDADY